MNHIVWRATGGADAPTQAVCARLASEVTGIDASAILSAWTSGTAVAWDIVNPYYAARVELVWGSAPGVAQVVVVPQDIPLSEHAKIAKELMPSDVSVVVGIADAHVPADDLDDLYAAAGYEYIPGGHHHHAAEHTRLRDALMSHPWPDMTLFASPQWTDEPDSCSSSSMGSFQMYQD